MGVTAPVGNATVPGRVCLAGEDLDWLGGGSVLAAVGLRLTASFEPDTANSALSITAKGTVNSSLRIDLRQPYRPVGHLLDLAALSHAYAIASGAGSGPGRLHIASDIPAAAGLASSAALCVAVLAAVDPRFHYGQNKFDLAEAAFLVEAELAGRAVGRMDQVAAVRGGVTFVDVNADGTVQVSELTLPDHACFVIADSGERRDTDRIIRWKQERWLAGDTGMRDYARGTADVVERQRKLLGTRCAIDELGATMLEAHQLMVDSLAVGTEACESLVTDLVAAGAAGAKITGTGCGGCVVAIVDDRELESIRGKLRNSPIRIFAPDVADDGLRNHGVTLSG